MRYGLDRQSNTSCPSNCFARLAARFEATDHNPSIPYNSAIQTGVSHAFYSATPIAVEPRFGFAWSPFGSTTTVLRGGIGNFRDFIPQQSLQGFTLNSPNVNSFNVTGNLSPDVANNIFSNANTSNATFLKGFSQGATLAELVATDPGFSPPSLYGAQKQTRNPTYLKWNLELQHAVGPTTTLSLNYVGNHGVHEIFINPSLNAFAAAGFRRLTCNSSRLSLWASHRVAIGRNLSVSRVSCFPTAQLCPQLPGNGLLYLEPCAGRCDPQRVHDVGLRNSTQSSVSADSFESTCKLRKQ